MRRALLIASLALCWPTLAAEPAIHVSLEGRWEGAAPDGTKLWYEFTRDGRITWFVEEENFKKMCPKGLPGKYAIRVDQPNWQIDITDFDNPQFKQFKFLGIIALIDGKSFRMQGRPGQRPREFGDEAITFRAAPR